MMMSMTEAPVTPAPIPGERTLLIVEDDKSFLQRLARAMEARGFEVRTAESVSEGLQAVETSARRVEVGAEVEPRSARERSMLED